MAGLLSNNNQDNSDNDNSDNAQQSSDSSSSPSNPQATGLINSQGSNPVANANRGVLAAAAGADTPQLTTSGQLDSIANSSPDINLDSASKAASLNEAKFQTSGDMGPIDVKADMKGINPMSVNADWMEGYMKAKHLQMDAAIVNIKLQDQAFKTTDRAEQAVISDGMAKASASGGYQGVIDYLKGVDPDRAMSFTQNKLALDASMAKNDVMQAALPGMKVQAMVDGYKALGNMGYALLKAPPGDRDNMYKTMLPMIRTVNPDAPDSLDGGGTSMMMLAASQADNKSLLATTGLGQNVMKTQIGQTSAALNDLAAQGKQNTPLFKDLTDHLNGLKANDQKLGFENIKAQAAAMLGQQGQNPEANAKLGMALTKQLEDQTKASGYYKNLEETKHVMAELDTIDKYGAGSKQAALATGALRMSLARMLHGGRPTAADYAHAQAAGGGAVISKNVQAWAEGQQVAFAPWEVSQASVLMKTLVNNQLNDQHTLENQHKKFANSFTGQNGQPLINWDAIPKPSAAMDAIMHPALDQQAKTNALNKQAQDAIKAGADPKAVMSRFQQLTGQQVPQQ